MNILLTTIVDNSNIGTYLQIYATVKKLKERGHNVSVLNYERAYIVNREYALNLWKDKNFIIRNLFSFYYVLINMFKINYLKKFLIRKKVTLTRHFKSIYDIKKNLNHYDLYMTGSDQVWNCIHNANKLDEVYFLNFTSGKKYAYAASIGMDNIPDEYKSRFKQLLNDYEGISVRENKAVELLNQLGIENVELVLDPTLLLNRQDWLQEIGDMDFHKVNPFVLIYSVEEDCNKLILEVAKKIAKEKNYRIYFVSSTKVSLYLRQHVDRCFEKASPELFLALFDAADFIVVSSFHGTAFSINFNKPFLTVAPKRFSSRVQSLLQLFDLTHCYINSNNFNLPTIYYSEINKKLQILRNKSEKIINSYLTQKIQK